MSEGFTIGRNVIGISVQSISLDLYHHWYPSLIVGLADWCSNHCSNRLTTLCIPVPLEYWCAKQNCYSIMRGRIRAVLFILPYCHLTIYQQTFSGLFVFILKSLRYWNSLKHYALTLTHGFPTVALGPSRGPRV